MTQFSFACPWWSSRNLVTMSEPEMQRNSHCRIQVPRKRMALAHVIETALISAGNGHVRGQHATLTVSMPSSWLKWSISHPLCTWGEQDLCDRTTTEANGVMCTTHPRLGPVDKKNSSLRILEDRKSRWRYQQGWPLVKAVPCLHCRQTKQNKTKCSLRFFFLLLSLSSPSSSWEWNGWGGFSFKIGPHVAQARRTYNVAKNNLENSEFLTFLPPPFLALMNSYFKDTFIFILYVCVCECHRVSALHVCVSAVVSQLYTYV